MTAAMPVSCICVCVCVQEAVRLRPSYADAYTGMGVSLKELKRKEEAEQCFAQVVRLRPNCALSLGNLAGNPPTPHLTHNCTTSLIHNTLYNQVLF